MKLGEKGNCGLYHRWGKRFLDLVLTMPALILLTPVKAVIAIFVPAKIGRPVMFRQERPGLKGKPFTIYKFCTMMDERDEDGKLLPDKERLTKLGRFLRNTSMDELP